MRRMLINVIKISKENAYIKRRFFFGNIALK